MNLPSDTAPTISTVSLMTVLGTDTISYFWASSGNSVTSTTSAVTTLHACASLWAILATRGQYGQVGVTKTWMCVGPTISPNRSEVAGARPGEPLESDMMSSTRVANS